jgi:phage replication O-like protein O
MANPQVENGHIDIANELAEALAGIRISGEENQCLWVIIRKTYGWHKKRDAIPLSQFVDLTGIDKPHTLRALNKLALKKIITVANIGNEPAKVYGINKDYDKWKALPKKATLPILAISVAKKGNPSLPIMAPQKKTTSKENKEKRKTLPPCPEFISKSTWEDFIEHRKTTKPPSPLSAKAAELIFSKLERWKSAKGWNPDDVLNQSIENGWKGVFELKTGTHRDTSPPARARPKCYEDVTDPQGKEWTGPVPESFKKWT